MKTATLTTVNYEPGHWNQAVGRMTPACWIAHVDSHDQFAGIVSFRAETHAAAIKAASREFPGLIK